MKNLKDCLTVNEGWVGGEGSKAYDKILSVMESWKPEEILTLIWNYYNQDQLKNLYKWMEEDGYFD